MNRNNPLEPQSFIATSRYEIIAAAGSKYCPVPLNVALKELLAKDKKYAVVGLPCHMHGIRKAETHFARLRENIVLHVGLFCSHTVNFVGTQFLLEKMRIKREQVTGLKYRGMGWPGTMVIQFEGNSRLEIPYLEGWNAYWPIFSAFFFAPYRCLICPDLTNELSDISFGDAWLPELKQERLGESVVITRKNIAEDILTLMSSVKMISIRQVSLRKAIQSQKFGIGFKKKDLASRLTLLRLLGKETPRFIPQPSSPSSFMAYLRALIPYFSIWASSNKHIRPFLTNIPFPVFRLYSKVSKVLSLEGFS
jgi:coenzyme F420 hydrogenase subunit beta